MKNVYTLTYSLLILLLMSCEKQYGKYIEAVTDITVLNQQGQNLLADPAT